MTTGKRLGLIIDVIINAEGNIKSLILEEKKMKRLSSREEYELDWKQIAKIGDDIILVKDKYADEVTIVSETEDDLVDKLGNKVLSRIKAVENSPLYVGKPKQFWKNGSKYKGYITFWKHNFLAYVKLFEDGSYEIYSTKKFREKKGGYNGCIKSINLPANATAEEIGNAIIDVFKAAEEYYERNPMEY